ncbi:nitrite reductase small subunit NirD [Leptospira fletcheri]|uniref:Nitrite reductase small subunit NirD n=1 Tax=Leptospira fletcheri TaxID=2484981 RepID=A0A4R9GJY7_9LEPT|nr:nitrite reductase small subunit NirD [Leptospira fletcheri]TGK14054.1 nitrite reductase small subunit NirD [Leptospira fletcheri]
MTTKTTEKNRFLVAPVSEFPEDGGVCVKIGSYQIAVFRSTVRDKWYACDNFCPHSGDPVLSRGILGDSKGEPKVACPLHKRNFSLKTGECIGGEAHYKVEIYPVVIENGNVYLEVDAAMVRNGKNP